jgi:hypothetical protein
VLFELLFFLCCRCRLSNTGCELLESDPVVRFMYHPSLSYLARSRPSGMTGLPSVLPIFAAPLHSTDGVVAGHDDVTTFLQFSSSTRPLPTVASAILEMVLLCSESESFFFSFGLVWSRLAWLGSEKI